jgi:hypothetical protein
MFHGANGRGALVDAQGRQKFIAPQRRLVNQYLATPSYRKNVAGLPRNKKTPAGFAIPAGVGFKWLVFL